MTSDTRFDLTMRINQRAATDSDMDLMRLYLFPFSSDAEYRKQAVDFLEFFAVLATEEYSRVWEERAKSVGANAAPLPSVAALESMEVKA